MTWMMVAAAMLAAAPAVSRAQGTAPPSASTTFPQLELLSEETRAIYSTIAGSIVRVDVNQSAAAVLDREPELRGQFEEWRRSSEGNPDRNRGNRNDGGGRGQRPGRGNGGGMGPPDGIAGPGRGGGGFQGGGPGGGNQVEDFLGSKLRDPSTPSEKKELYAGLMLRARLNRNGFQGEMSALVINSGGFVLLPTGLLREGHKDPLSITLADDSRVPARFVGTNLYSGYSVLQLQVEGDKIKLLRPVTWSQSKVQPGSVLFAMTAGEGTCSLPIAASRPGQPITDRFTIRMDDRSGAFLFDVHGELAGVAMSGGGGWNTERTAIATARLRREVEYIIKNNKDIEPRSLGVSFDLLSKDASRAAALKDIIGTRRAVQVNTVDPDSLAASAGLKKGDVILSIDNRPMSALVTNDSPPRPTMELLQLQVDLATRPGKIPMRVVRAGSNSEASLEVPISQ